MSTGTRIALAVLLCAGSASRSAVGQAPLREPFPMSRLPAVEPASQLVRGPTSQNLYRHSDHSRYLAGSYSGSAASVAASPPGSSELADLPPPERSVADQLRVEPLQIETLQQAWQQAVAVDQQLMAGAANIDAATRELDAAAAQRYPLAGVSGQYTLRDNEPSFLITTPLLPYTFTNPYQQADDFAFEGRVDVPLYTGGRVTSQIATAQCKVRATECQLARYQLDLKMRVAEDYVSVLRAQQEVLVAESHERSLASHAHDTELMHNQQRAPRNDLLAAQVALCDAQHQVIKARSDLDAARASYNRRLGRQLTAPVQLATLQASSVAYDVERLTSEALARREELSQLDAQIAAHRHRAESAAAENRAQVHVQGAYTFRENRYQTPEGITSAGLGVWWNLYDGGRAKNLSAAELQQAQALAHARADLQSQIQLEVRRAWLAVQETRQRLQVTRQAIERAEENVRVTRQRYAAGMATNTDVLGAESLRIQTYRNHNNSTYDAALADLRLHRAVGTL